MFLKFLRKFVPVFKIIHVASLFLDFTNCIPFCGIFPCKKSDFSFFLKEFGGLHACTLHGLSASLTRGPV